MTTPIEDAQLLARVAGGDHQAFTLVMEAHQDRIFAVCLRILANRENALDATQETFLTAFRKAHQFQGNSALGTWLYRIAVNTCLNFRASRKPEAQELPDALPDPRRGVSAVLESEEEGRRVREAVRDRKSVV